MFEVFTITAPSAINTLTNTGIPDINKPISVWIYHSGYQQWYLVDAIADSNMQILLADGYIQILIGSDVWVNQTMKFVCVKKDL